MEATAVFLQEREHRCSSISLLSVSDYLFWQQSRERGRTEAGMQLLSISLGSAGTGCLNTKNVQRGIFSGFQTIKKVKACTNGSPSSHLEQKLSDQDKKHNSESRGYFRKKVILRTIEKISLIEACVCIPIYINVCIQKFKYICKICISCAISRKICNFSQTVD